MALLAMGHNIMELPLTPSARPRAGLAAVFGRRLRDASLRGGGAYRDEPYRDAYGTSLLTGRASCAEALMDEPPYERIFFTGRRRLRDASLTGGRDEPLYGPETLTGQACLRAGGGGLRDGGAGTSLLTGRRRRRLRDEPPHTSLLRGGTQSH